MRLTYNSIFLRFIVSFLPKKLAKMNMVIVTMLRKILHLKIILEKEGLLYTKGLLKLVRFLKYGMLGYIMQKLILQILI